MKFGNLEIPPKENEVYENQKEEFTRILNKELKDALNAPSFILEKTGGLERYINRSFIPTLFSSSQNIQLGIKNTIDFFEEKNISTQKQLEILNGIKLSLNDIQLLESDENADYEHVQFAYQWAGLARDKWKLSQDEIGKIMDITKQTFLEESNRENIPYLVSIYTSGENMVSRQSKIERFMQNMTPNLIDKNKYIYHFDPTGDKPIFLKIDTEEKRNFVDEILKEYKKGWNKMFTEYPTVKTYTHYELPKEFDKFILSKKEVENYFPHIAFEGKGVGKKEILRSEMKNMLNPVLRDSLSKDLGIDLCDMGPEQAYFIEYIASKKKGETKQLKLFVDNFNKDGIKTFLSCAQDIKIGDKILELGEKLPEDVAEEVFKKYGEIINVTDNAYVILNDLLPKGVIDESLDKINEIKEAMLVRAKDLLITFYDKKENNPENLLKDLERYKSEVLLYADTYKKLKQSGKEIKLEDIKNTQITILSQEEKEKVANTLWDITKANRPFIKDGTTEMENRQKNFYKNIENKNSDLYVLKHKEDILAFCSSTLDENGDIYVESLNVESEIKSSKVGGEFFPIVLEKLKILNRNIYGHVHPGNSGILNYYERLGFQIKEVIESGELKYYEIRIPTEERLKIAA